MTSATSRRAADDPAPFIIYALPRSRTAWLSAFLTYGDWVCTHEQAVTMRGFDDLRAFFARPRIGSAETVMAPGWHLIHHMAPHIREVVIHRPIEDALASALKLDISGIGPYDGAVLERELRRNFTYLARCLRRIAARPGVLSLDYGELETEDACKRIFEHCLPYDFDRDWWCGLKNHNIQNDVLSHIRYCLTHRAALEHFKSECKSTLRRLARAGEIPYGAGPRART